MGKRRLSPLFLHLVKIVLLLVLVIYLIGEATILAMDQGLMSRPRHKWEWNPDKKPSDVDHLGRGWDQLYLGNRSRTEQERRFHYENAQNEFNYLLNYLMNFNYQNNLPLVNHDFIGAAMGMAEVGSRTKRPNLAKPIYELGIRQSENTPILYVHYALYLKVQGLLHEAIAVIEKAVTLWDKEAGLHHYLGGLYFENKNYDKARKEVEITDQLGGINTDELKEKLNSVFDKKKSDTRN